MSMYNDTRHTKHEQGGRRAPHFRGQRGFTLLLAALISSIVLALGSSIFSIAQKQVTLSSIGRDSQFAFYAADAAAECALYWDFRHQYFGTTTAGVVTAPNPDVSALCDGQPMAPLTALQGLPSGVQTYPYELQSATMDFFTQAGVTPPIDLCAQVTVTKCDGIIASGGICASSGSSVIHTLIHADGYSTACANIATSPRTLQRSVELRY